MEIHLVRTSTGLRPYTDDDYEEMKKIKVRFHRQGEYSSTKEHQVSPQVLLPYQSSMGLSQRAAAHKPTFYRHIP